MLCRNYPVKASIAALQARPTLRCGTMGLTHKSDRRICLLYTSNLNYSEDDSPLALKSDFILSLCELVIGGKEGLQPVDKTVIDRAVRNVYRDYLADPVPEKMPILGDLYDELLKQPEPEAGKVHEKCTGRISSRGKRERNPRGPATNQRLSLIHI